MESLTKSLPRSIKYYTVDQSVLQKNHAAYLKVPKDLKRNLLFRKEIIKRCLENEDYAKEIRRICKQDILFYLNVFAWTYNPKNKSHLKVLPFITYETYQDKFILECVDAIFKGEDIAVEKSRDMGGSWIPLYAIEWVWHFYPMESFLLGSRKEEYVEDPGNPRALFWKFDFHVEHLPSFLRPIVEKTDMHRKNLFNGSVVDGESTNENFARGDRRTAILLDEFAAVENGYRILESTRDATNCRIYVSTPKGSCNAFYDVTQLDIRKVTLHWTLHPEKTKGLYRFLEDGSLQILDKTYNFTSDYKFINRGAGVYSSTWYDTQRRRCASDREAAQELDINYFGSGDQFFDDRFIKETYMNLHCTYPWFEGNLVIDDEDTMASHFEQKAGGKLKLWITLNPDGSVPSGYYGAGADISAGTGASNSVISVINLDTGEKIAEWCDTRTSPEAMAKIAAMIGKFFHEAYFIWEMNGPGQIFSNKFIDTYHYENIYFRQNDTSITKKVTDLPGWWNTGDSKVVLLGGYRNALSGQTFINHSEYAVKETLQYVYTKSGVEHSSSLNNDEETSSSKKHHGDRVIADALCWKICEQHEKRKKEEPEAADDNSVGGRRESFLKKSKEEERGGDGWD